MRRIAIKKSGKSVLVGIFFPVGSRHESTENKGISHFLEHMLFKGTKTRSKEDISREIEQYGATFNACTSEEYTLYYIKIDSEYRQVAIDVLTDMIRNANFPKKEIENERNVIIQELNMYEDDPRSYLAEIVQRTVYDKSSGLHTPIIGTKESLAGIGRKELQKYYKKMYSDPILIEIGDTEPERNIIKLPCLFEPEVRAYSKEDLFVSKKGISQANMALVKVTDYPDKILTQFWMSLLSGVMNGFTGRLFKTIRDKHGLVYHVSFAGGSYSCGTINSCVQAACSPDKVLKARDLIIKELIRPITKEEIEFAKRKMIGKYKLSSNSDSFIAGILIESAILGLDYNEFLKNYEKNIEIASRSINDFVFHLGLENSKLIALMPEETK